MNGNSCYIGYLSSQHISKKSHPPYTLNGRYTLTMGDITQQDSDSLMHYIPSNVLQSY